MNIFLHQTHHTIADFGAIFDYLKNIFKGDPKNGIHLFPEVFLAGYPLQDLCLQKTFISSYLKFLDQINDWSKNLEANSEILMIMGGLEYTLAENGLLKTIKNVIYTLEPGKELKSVYTKRLLPNYDIFEEVKYFAPGDSIEILDWNNKKIALMICADMWASNLFKCNPVKDLYDHIKQNDLKLDFIVNLSASPYYLGKEQKRIIRGTEISNLLAAPFAYINRVGGEDEILFDGASFVVSGDTMVKQGNLFLPDLLELELPVMSKKEIEELHPSFEAENTWESLFNPNLDMKITPPQVPPLSDSDCEQILHALKFGIQEYASKAGMSNFLVALSGGIDSALVLTIARLILNKDQTLEAIFMPGFYSATESYEYSDLLIRNLNIKLNTIPIKFFHSAIKNSFQENFRTSLEGLADENIQSRLRGALLYTRANQLNSMVLNTSNKSELAVGYSTLYGDSVGALSILGDLYKTEVYQLAHYINKKFCGLIPEGIITRPPSAELRKDQADAQSLPPYERLDAILEGLLSNRMNIDDLVELGFARDEVEKVYGLYHKSEYKRYQFCPIIKLKSKSFGFGYRMPICKNI